MINRYIYIISFLLSSTFGVINNFLIIIEPNDENQLSIIHYKFITSDTTKINKVSMLLPDNTDQSNIIGYDGILLHDISDNSILFDISSDNAYIELAIPYKSNELNHQMNFSYPFSISQNTQLLSIVVIVPNEAIGFVTNLEESATDLPIESGIDNMVYYSTYKNYSSNMIIDIDFSYEKSDIRKKFGIPAYENQSSNIKMNTNYYIFFVAIIAIMLFFISSVSKRYANKNLNKE